MLKAKRLIKKSRNLERKGEQMRHKRLHLPFVRFCYLLPLMTKETIAALKTIQPPSVFMDDAIPGDLQAVTFGTLVALQQSAVDDNYFASCVNLVSALTDKPKDAISVAKAEDVLGIVNMAQREMERIGKLFQSLHAENSADEVSAGIDRLDFGAFGLVDWYAKRMGIANHDEVFATPWQRVFQCMKIDFENNEFEKRYRNIIERRNRK